MEELKEKVSILRSIRGGHGPLVDLRGAPPIAKVIARIKAMANTTDEQTVSGAFSLPEAQDVVKVDTLKFSNFSTLIFTGMRHDYVVIASKTLVLDIENPDFQAKITRPYGSIEDQLRASYAGSRGVDGPGGPDGSGEIDRIGNPGGDGGNGGDGNPGRSVYLPPLFLFVKQIVFGGAATPRRGFLQIDWEGFRGANGGNGGKGGAGGTGADGKEGADTPFECKEGAGRGGIGGAAGRGGRGGDAANGTEGGVVFLCAPDVSIFNFVATYVGGGKAGDPGQPGPNGDRGRGGHGGGWNGHCRPGDHGPAGPLPPENVKGNAGFPGGPGATPHMAVDVWA